MQKLLTFDYPDLTILPNTDTVKRPNWLLGEAGGTGSQALCSKLCILYCFRGLQNTAILLQTSGPGRRRTRSPRPWADSTCEGLGVPGGRARADRPLRGSHPAADCPRRGPVSQRIKLSTSRPAAPGPERKRAEGCPPASCSSSAIRK